MHVLSVNQYNWQKIRYQIPSKKVGKRDRYFVQFNRVVDDTVVKNMLPVEFGQKKDPILEQLQNNVSFDDMAEDDAQLSKQLKQARLQSIKTDTKLKNQKLDQRKKLLFAEWSQKFFQAFADHFGKLRNVVVELHLNEQQVAKFNQTLDNCLSNLQLNLDQIWDGFINQEKKDETEEIQEV